MADCRILQQAMKTTACYDTLLETTADYGIQLQTIAIYHRLPYYPVSADNCRLLHTNVDYS